MKHCVCSVKGRLVTVDGREAPPCWAPYVTDQLNPLSLHTPALSRAICTAESPLHHTPVLCRAAAHARPALTPRALPIKIIHTDMRTRMRAHAYVRACIRACTHPARADDALPCRCRRLDDLPDRCRALIRACTRACVCMCVHTYDGSMIFRTDAVCSYVHAPKHAC